MKIKLLLTALICFNVAAPVFAGMYADPYNEQVKEQPKLRKTILQKMNAKLDELEQRYHVKSYALAIAANVLMISISLRMQDQLTSPKEFKEVHATDPSLPGFADLIGLDQAKQAAQPMIDYMKNPQAFHDIGAQVPKGCILSGPPGIGKTEFARALAKEANAAFFTINGSDFNGLYRGSGTKQLKKLEAAARAAAIKYGFCIVNIEEIDNLIGKANGFGFESDTNATTCTFKAMLDGFEKEKLNIFWIGSTNNPGIIDPAIIRDGRMPIIEVAPPTLSDVERIFERKLYHGKVKTESGIDIKALTEKVYFDENKNPVNFTGANVTALINKAAILAIQKGLKAITESAIAEAIINTPRINDKHPVSAFAIPPMPQQVPAIL